MPRAINLSHFEPLVPDRQRGYALLIIEALEFFVTQLPPHRVESIRTVMETSATAGSRPQQLAALMRECPTLHKLGQVLAHHRELSAELRTALQGLEVLAPQPEGDASIAVRKELGAAAPAGLRIGTHAIAEGSVAIVVPFEWTADSAEVDSAPRGVFKVLKPDVESKLDDELEVFGGLGAFLEERSRQYALPNVEYAEVLEEVGSLLRSEVRLENEQAHLASAAKVYQRFSGVRIPDLLPFCTPRLTAMTFVEGEKVTDAAKPAAAKRDQMAETIVRALITTPTFGDAARAMFHADPHAGNLLADGDGNVGILDWSLVGYLDKDVRACITRMVLDAMLLDGSALCRTITKLSSFTPDEGALRDVTNHAVERICHGSFPGIAWLTALLDSAATRARVRLSRDLLLFRKSLLTLEGVVADVSAECDIDRVLICEAMACAAAEWPARYWVRPTSRAFRTHLSNLDLVALAFRAPWAPFRAALSLYR
ncbi:MAG: AarF/UbiB family protein [Planctomycetota bacterium]